MKPEHGFILSIIIIISIVGVLGLSVLFGFQWLVYSVFIGLVWFGIGLFMVFYKRKKEDKREEEQEKKN